MACEHLLKKRLSEVNTSANTPSEIWCILNTILQEAITNFIPHKLVSGERIKPPVSYTHLTLPTKRIV